jgi:hypothetical protein
MHDTSLTELNDGTERRGPRPSPVRDRLDDLDYDLDYERELADFEISESRE